MPGTIRDRNIGWVRKMRYYPATFANGIVGATAATYAANGPFATLDGGATKASFSQVTGTFITGLQTVTAGAVGTGDGLSMAVDIPHDLDPTKNIGVSVVWTKDTTGTTHVTSATWGLVYALYNFGTNIFNASGGTLVAAATALNTAIAAQTVGAADSLIVYVSPRGILNANTLVNTNGFWGLRPFLSAATASFNDKVWLLGVLVDYDLKKTFGPPRTQATQLLIKWLDQSPAPVTQTP